MKLIDTNVFIYAIGGDHPYREACRKVLRAGTSNAMEATTDVEVCQELLHHYHSIRMTQRAAQVVAEALAAFPDAISITVPVISRAAKILEANPPLQARDAVHAAVVFEHGLEGIVSADVGFDGIEGLTRFDPRQF